MHPVKRGEIARSTAASQIAQLMAGSCLTATDVFII
jgi:hypothetical protein